MSSPPSYDPADGALQRCISLLSDFIGYRTVNPGGDELALCRHLVPILEKLGADEIITAEVARPDREVGGYVYARYGKPRTVINIHIDTVPVNRGWQHDPFVAEVEDGRLYGLGSADTKGAIAALLVALESVRPRDVGILLSGDEENGTACTTAFLASEYLQGIEKALVCEPTGRRAGIRHRGLRAYRFAVQGQGGHSSKADYMPKPVVDMARLAVFLDEVGVKNRDVGPEDMRGLCMNVASIEGGVAFNVIPDSAAMHMSIRQPPGFDDAGFDAEVQRLAASVNQGISTAVELVFAPFACREPDSFSPLVGPFVDDYGPLDFWTEAALWSDAGVDAVVLGPGNIAQAHAPDEYVTLADLSWAIELFTHVLQHSAR